MNTKKKNVDFIQNIHMLLDPRFPSPPPLADLRKLVISNKTWRVGGSITPYRNPYVV